jgi:hypothetical protein
LFAKIHHFRHFTILRPPKNNTNKERFVSESRHLRHHWHNCDINCDRLFLFNNCDRLFLSVRDSSRQAAPSPSLCYSLTHAHRSIGYRNHNRNPQSLSESTARLMYLRVYDNRDSSRQTAPSPSLCYSLTHAHRSIGYRNRNPQPLAESAAR